MTGLRSALILSAISVLAAPQLARSETLFDALSLAFQTNPTLRAQRAQLDADDEGYVQARAVLGPQVSIQTQYGYQDARVQEGRNFFGQETTTDYRANTGSAELSAVQPLYQSGAARAQIRAAAADVLASREELRQAESQLLENVITAYEDVRRDRETIAILKDEIVALTNDFNETRAKGALGAVTKTDVAQSEARLLSAQAQLNLAMGKLNVSNSEYLAYVGQSPGELAPEPELAGLPPTSDQAFDAADHNNPRLLAAVQGERAAREKVNQAKAANGASISLRLDASAAPYAPYLQRQYQQSVTASVVVNQPLFTSGMNSSKVRAALDEDNRAQLEVETTRRGVVQLVGQAWDQLVSTRTALQLQQRQLEMEQVALQGNRVEERVGARSTIDLLNAELELANARLSLAQSRHDEYVARASLLSAMGLLELRYLLPGSTPFDPTTHLKHVAPLDAPPWEGVVGAADQIGAASTPAPRLSPPDAGAAHPDDLPPLPTPTP